MSTEPTPLSAEELETVFTAGAAWCDVTTFDRVRATIDAQATEIAALKGQRDKAETTLEMVNALATGYGWLSEGRGMYAYDDGRYDDDVRTFVGQLLELMPSGNWLGFPEWEAKYRAMEAEIAALKGALTKAIEDMQWMFGGWGITDEDQLANGRVVAHQNIEALRRVLAGKEA